MRMKLRTPIVILSLSSLGEAALRSRRTSTMEAPKDCAVVTCHEDQSCEIVNGYAQCVTAPEVQDAAIAEGDVACTADVFECPDGSFVGRDPYYNCEFYECPLHICDTDLHHCPGGSTVARNPDLNCEFDPCSPVVCTTDVKECDDGSTVGRDPEYDCEFFLCPPPSLDHAGDDLPDCGTDARTCEDGTSVGRDPYKNCDFLPCPEDYYEANPCDDADCKPMSQTCEVNEQTGTARCVDLECTNETKECSSGATVTRNPKNGCQFDACPPATCTQDVKACPGRGHVGRNPHNNCEFYNCPSPGFSFGDGGGLFGTGFGSGGAGAGGGFGGSLSSMEDFRNNFFSKTKVGFGSFPVFSARIGGECDEEVCSLSADIGPCRALMEHFHYSKESGQCEPFNYGGCHGNANNFETMDECNAKCAGCTSVGHGGW